MGREASFFDLAQRKDGMDLEHYTPYGFWGIGGGMEIVTNDYHSIFRSTDFHYLVKVTNFLINSIYWIHGKRCDRFDIDDDYPNDVVLRTTGNKEIRLTNNNTDSEVQLSFTLQGKSFNYERGIRYFEGVTISKVEWTNAVTLALNEYFEVLIRVIDDNADDQTSKVMLGYYDVWKNISVPIE
jgi:hypothetical protein